MGMLVLQTEDVHLIVEGEVSAQLLHGFGHVMLQNWKRATPLTEQYIGYT